LPPRVVNRSFLSSLFILNNQMNEAVDNMTTEVSQAVDDAQAYLKTTSKQVDSAFVDNFGTLNGLLNKAVDDSSK